MRRTSIPLLILTLGFVAVATQAAENPAQIEHVRVGGHAKYDRLVLELDSPAEVVWRAVGDPPAPIFEVAARPLHPQALDTALPRLGTIRIESIPAGTRLRLDSRPRRIRVFRLEKPARIVLDFADPGPEPFEAPRGTHAIVSQEHSRLTRAPQPAPEPTRPGAPMKKAPARDAASKPAPPAPSAPMATAPPARKPAVAPAPAPKPVPPETAAAEPKRRSPFQPPAPDLMARAKEIPPPATAPKPATKPASRRAPPAAQRPGKPSPAPRPAGRFGGENLGLWLGLGAVGGVALLMVLGWAIRRGGARPRAEAPRGSASEEFPPELISPEEVYGAGNRAEILDKRLDEEVRARMLLEERVLQASEEIKVLRDRLARLERRRGA